MRAGDLDRRITIQRAVTVQDSLGQPVSTWTDLVTVWAKVDWREGGESIEAGEQRSAKQAVLFTVRWMRLLDPQHRVLFEGRAYEIDDVQEVGRREGLILTSYAREVRPGSV